MFFLLKVVFCSGLLVMRLYLVYWNCWVFLIVMYCGLLLLVLVMGCIWKVGFLN